MKVKINLFALITIPLALWLGFTGRVGWWIILLVALSHLEYTISLKSKH